MSEQFFLFCCDVPLGSVEDLSQAVRTKLQGQDLRVALQAAEDWVGFHFGEIDPEDGDDVAAPTDEEIIDAVVRRYIECLTYLRGDSSDFIQATLRGHDYYFSGGLSWGDLPAEACDCISFLTALALDKITLMDAPASEE
jgi:hypothetical protein